MVSFNMQGLLKKFLSNNKMSAQPWHTTLLQTVPKLRRVRFWF